MGEGRRKLIGDKSEVVGARTDSPVYAITVVLSGCKKRFVDIDGEIGVKSLRVTIN